MAADPFYHISSSQELTPDPSPTSFDDDSQQSETYKRLRVQPTGIFLVTPPTSAEPNDGTPSQDKFETPPEEAVPAASSEERWFGCEEKTVDLDRDTDLGFSETEMPQRTAAESESGGLKLLKVEIVENQWTEFVKWKKKMAFRERLLEEQPVKELVCEKGSKLDSTGAASGVGVGVGVDEEKSRGGTVKSVTDLKSDSGAPGLKSVQSMQMRSQMSVKSNGCTKSVSLDSEVNSRALDTGMFNNGLELNVSTQVLSSVSGGKDHISEVGMAKNGMGSSDCTEAVNLGSGGRSRVANAGIDLDLKDCSGVVGLDSRSKGLVVDAGMDENVLESNDHTEVLSLGTGGKGQISDQGIAKNHMEANSSIQVIMLDSGDDDMVLDEDTSKLGMALDGSTEEIVADSDYECLVTNEVIVKQGLASNVSTQVVEDEGLVSGADVAKKKPALSCGNEKVDNTPNVMHSGKGMVGLKNIEDIEKFRYVSPSDSNSKQTPKVARVLPSSVHAPGKEGDSGKNPSTHLLSFALRKLRKTDPDPMLKTLSLKEIAKRRGVTFPEPSWWVKEDDEG